MPETCIFPLCPQPVHDDELCYQHWRVYGVRKEKVKKAIPKKSDKRKEEEKEYKKIVKEMLAESDSCELKVSGICTKKAQGLHHQKKRGKNYLNMKYLKRACNACNNWCESHPLEAIELGLSLSKFK